MSWKSIEMQVAIPRTQDAGKHQDQMSKQSQRFQESLAQSQLKQQLLERKRVTEFERTKGMKITKENNDESNNSSDHEEQQEPASEEETIDHPFLGTKVDLTR